jgi:hypothetical protein
MTGPVVQRTSKVTQLSRTSILRDLPDAGVALVGPVLYSPLPLYIRIQFQATRDPICPNVAASLSMQRSQIENQLPQILSLLFYLLNYFSIIILSPLATPFLFPS